MQMSRWLVARASVFLFIMGWIRRMTIGVRAVLVDQDRVLLIKHSYIPGWHFPGGGIDPGETIDEGVRREVLEETGYRINGSIETFGHYLNTIPPGRDHVVVFVCRDFEVAKSFTPNNEIVAVEWFSKDELPAETSKATRRRIAEIFSGEVRERAWTD